LPVDNEIAEWQVRVMKLDQYLSETNKRPSAFAAEIGVAPSTITRLLKGERSPRLDLIALIQKGSDGKVTANDFLDAQEAAQ
jgi:transcriptional regulator with XRE-family HTH domain